MKGLGSLKRALAASTVPEEHDTTDSETETAKRKRPARPPQPGPGPSPSTGPGPGQEALADEETEDEREEEEEDDPEGMFEVSAIMDRRWNKKKKNWEYKIRWKVSEHTSFAATSCRGHMQLIPCRAIPRRTIRGSPQPACS